jgi:hypothetical protein
MAVGTIVEIIFRLVIRIPVIFQEHGFRVVSDENLEDVDETDAAEVASSATAAASNPPSKNGISMSSSVALLSPETVEMLEAYSGTLGKNRCALNEHVG